MTEFAFEPDTKAYLERFAQQPPRENQSLDDLRADYSANLQADSVVLEVSVEVRDLVIEDGKGNPMFARLYLPAGSTQDGPLLVYVHGGGFAVGDLDSHDRLARLIAASANLRVLTFDYRRAPEAPFPAGRDDSIAAFRWAVANAASLGIDRHAIAIGGESAGAAHAAAAALSLAQSDAIEPAALWVMSPALDATGSSESYASYALGAGRTTAEFAYLWSLYAPDETTRASADVSPLFADLSRLRRAFIYPAEFDPARSDGEQFAAKAKLAGVDVVMRLRQGVIHQYPEMTGVSAIARKAVVGAARELGAALADVTTNGTAMERASFSEE